MAFKPPQSLADRTDDSAALRLLHRYYGSPFLAGSAATGARFDLWDSLGTRDVDADLFTADDLVAVTFLSVSVPAPAAQRILGKDAQRLSELLAELGPDRDLVNEEEALDDNWVGWKVMCALRAYDGIGPTTASKLLARKRPRLRPIWDDVVTEVTDTFAEQWEPLRMALRADEHALHKRLLRLRSAAGLPDEISPLRVLDVIAWREGKDQLRS